MCFRTKYRCSHFSETYCPESLDPMFEESPEPCTTLAPEETVAAESYCCSEECAKKLLQKAFQTHETLKTGPKGDDGKATTVRSAHQKGLARLVEEAVDEEWKAYQVDKWMREKAARKQKEKEKKDADGDGDGDIVMG